MIEPITPTTPRPVRRAVLTQWWRDLAILHWPVAPHLVAPLLPPGTTPDTRGGVTYAGLIAFEMDRVGPGFGVPFFGRFPEINVRLYSVDAQGRRGVVFCSLEAARLAPVMVGRVLGLNYRWARMRMTRTSGGVWRHSSRRIGGSPGRCRLAVEPHHEIADDDLTHWLTDRWGLHVRRVGRSLYVPNEHPPWRMQTASLLELDETLITAAGLSVDPGAPVSVLYASGVPVRFGMPRPV